MTIANTLNAILVNLHTESFITDILRLSSTSLSWVTIVIEPKFHDEPKFDHERKMRQKGKGKGEHDTRLDGNGSISKDNLPSNFS